VLQRCNLHPSRFHPSCKIGSKMCCKWVNQRGGLTLLQTTRRGHFPLYISFRDCQTMLEMQYPIQYYFLTLAAALQKVCQYQGLPKCDCLQTCLGRLLAEYGRSLSTGKHGLVAVTSTINSYQIQGRQAYSPMYVESIPIFSAMFSTSMPSGPASRSNSTA
jgi:hypothetical protein